MSDQKPTSAMRQKLWNQLLKRLKQYGRPYNMDLISKAYDLAWEAMKTKSGSAASPTSSIR